MADGATLASPTLFQGESTAAAGVVQDVSDARDMSPVLPPTTTTATITIVAPPTNSFTPAPNTTAIAPSTPTTTAAVSDLHPQEGATVTSSDTPTTTTWWDYVGWGSVPPTSSEVSGVVPTVAAGQSGDEEEDVVGVVGVREESGVDVRGVGSDGGERGEQSQEGVVHMTGEDAGSDSPVLPATTSATTTWLTHWTWYYPSRSNMDVEVHSDSEKTQQHAVGEERVMHGHCNGLGPIEGPMTCPPSGLTLLIGLLPKDLPHSQEDDDEVQTRQEIG